MGYKLELPTASRVHPIFHVSCLKKFTGDKLLVQTILAELDEEGQIILKPEAVIETRTRQLRNRSISKYLIEWKNLPTEDSTWEEDNVIQSIHNYSSIEDNTFLKEKGMLGPYNTNDSPITIVLVPLIVVPLLSPYCYYCTP